MRYRTCLRLEFKYRCAYCLAHEREVAPSSLHGQFEIDHFRPESMFKHLRNVYTNLNWSCHACNHAKWHTWPSKEEVALGYRFVDICKDVPADHLEIQHDEVVAKSSAGHYTIDEINLNSLEHKQRRTERKRQLEIWKMLTSVAASLPLHDGDRRAVEREADDIFDLIVGECAPWDPVGSCLCVGSIT